LPRKVISRGISMTPYIEMHPLLLRVVRVVEQSDSEHGPVIPPIAVSEEDTLTQLSHALAAPYHKQGTPHRIWQDIITTERTRYPRAKLIEDNAKLLEESDEPVSKEIIQTGDIFAVEFQDEDGNWLVDADSIGQGAIVLRDPYVPPPLFGPGNDFFLTMQSSTSSSSPGASAIDKKTTPTKNWKSSTPTASSSKRNQDPGTLGLGNM
jgi:ubiquitin carboxyl-terminal hydrolase 4/11